MDSKPLILIPWYGAWPDYLALFLDGCRRNPEFEVCFFGEAPPPLALPPSVQFVAMPLAEFARRISAAIGCEVNIPNPYKICELKPALGLALQDYLKGREFWGFGDADVVWGDLKQFVSPQILSYVDIFCVQKTFVSGPFTLLRNSLLMNGMFLRSPDWRKVVTSPQYFNFDECARQWDALVDGATYGELSPLVCSFSEVVFKAIESGEIRGHFETTILERVQSEVQITPCGIFERHVAYAMLHYVRVKQRLTFGLPPWVAAPTHYRMTAAGLFLTPQGGIWERLRAVPYGKISKELRSRLRDRARRLGNRLVGKGLPKRSAS